MKENDIIISFGTHYGLMAGELCSQAGLAGLIRAKTGKGNPLIALKPNLLGPIPPSEGATTHPEIAEGILLYLKNEGFTNLVMMESSWVGDKTRDALLVTGFDDLSRRLGIPFWDLQEDRGVPADGAGMELSICERVKNVDFLINLPVLKGHCQTRMTCALKNMKGCIPASEKRRFHRLGLFEPIGHLSAAVCQDFILVDSICPDLLFEDGGSPVQLDRLIAGRDPVLVDALGCSLLGIDIKDVPYIKIAENCGIGSADLEHASIRILHPENQRPSESDGGDYRRLVRLKELVRDVDSCSACYASLIPALKRLRDEGYDLSTVGGHIEIGQGCRGKSGEIGIGSCTAKFQNTLRGCPPSEKEVYEFLKSFLP